MKKLSLIFGLLFLASCTKVHYQSYVCECVTYNNVNLLESPFSQDTLGFHITKVFTRYDTILASDKSSAQNICRGKQVIGISQNLSEFGYNWIQQTDTLCNIQ